MVDGLVDTGISIEIGTELHANGLAPRHDAKTLTDAGEILCAVKSHVLQEMSQATLAWLLENRAHTLCDIEIGQPGFLGIMTDIVGHAVLQYTLAYGWVLWQRLLR